MKSVNFVGSNVVMRKPEGMTDEECSALYVRHTPHGRFGTEYESMWKPDTKELAMLNSGGHVCLRVLGMAHPPVWVGAALGVIEKPPVVTGSGGGEASGGGLA